MGRGQVFYTIEQDLRRLPILSRYLRVVLRVLDGYGHIFIQFLGRPALQCGQGLMAGNRQKPGRDLGSALEPSGLPPDVQEHLADKILSSRPVRDKAEEKPKDPHVVAGKQSLHCMLVARGNRSKQRYVRRVRRLPSASNGIEPARGVAHGHDILSPSHQTYSYLREVPDSGDAHHNKKVPLAQSTIL